MPIRELLVVGDVHGMWDFADREFVERGVQDVVVFVGDIGDEDTSLVREIASLTCAHVVLLGNHDAWTAGRRDGSDVKVREQLATLGERHLAYRSWLAPGGDFALVGGRPFSWGGGWVGLRGLYERLFDVRNLDQSTQRIVAAAEATPDVPLILVGHNGPRGLGDGRDAIFGCDFRQPFTDFGDRDLRQALEQLRGDRQRRVLLTVAGHMHHRLVGGGLRQRRVDLDGVVHLNAARVPRHEPYGRGKQRHFLRIRVETDAILEAVLNTDDVWVDDGGEICSIEPLSSGLAAGGKRPGSL